MMDFDFNIYELEQEKINEICNKYPISWTQILQAIEAAIPLIEDVGPDAILIAVQNEKLRRSMYDKI